MSKAAKKNEESEKADEKKEVKMIEISEAEYQKLKDEVLEYKDKHLRLYAEFDNARKRMEREKVDFVKYANEGLFLDLLNIVDSLDQSLRTVTEKDHKIDESFLKGMELVRAQFSEVLKKYNVVAVKTVGEKFDLTCHEVLMQEESDEHEDGVIIEEYQKGYKFNDRVLRTAKVKVAKSKEESK